MNTSRLRLGLLLSLIVSLFGSQRTAAEPDAPVPSAYDPLMENLPAVLDRVREHNEPLKQALEPPGFQDQAASRTVETPSAGGDRETFRVSPEAIPQLRRDPFQISYLMQQKAHQKGTGEARFVAVPGVRTPAMSLKGLVNNRLALLEVEGAGVYLVREGDTLSLHKTGEHLVIKIDKIDALSLNVRVGALEEIIVVR